MLQVKLEPMPNPNARYFELTDGTIFIVDFPLPDCLLLYSWRAVLWHFRWYAISTSRFDGARCRVSMHRLIAETPPGQVCHHLNKNSLDNRRANLLNQIPRHHAELHRIRKFGRKNQKKTTIKGLFFIFIIVSFLIIIHVTRVCTRVKYFLIL